MDEDEFLGDDGELIPRKRKEDLITRRFVISILIFSAIIAGTAGSIAALVISSANVRSPPVQSVIVVTPAWLQGTLEALQNTQIALANVTAPPDFPATEAALSQTQIALEIAMAATPIPTPLPPEMCFCDNPQCFAGSMFLQRGEALTSFSTDPEKFGWYIVLNTSITGSEIHLYPANYLYSCDVPFDGCDVRGYFNSYQCAQMYAAQFCDATSCLRVVEPLKNP